MVYEKPKLGPSGHYISVDVELQKPIGDCDSPRIWPPGKWIAEFLRGITHTKLGTPYNFEFVEEGEHIKLRIPNNGATIEYLVVAQRPYSEALDDTFLTHNHKESYMDGYETLYFVDPKTNEVITSLPKHEKPRKDLEGVVIVLSSEINTIRQEED